MRAASGGAPPARGRAHGDRGAARRGGCRGRGRAAAAGRRAATGPPRGCAATARRHLIVRTAASLPAEADVGGCQQRRRGGKGERPPWSGSGGCRLERKARRRHRFLTPLFRRAGGTGALVVAAGASVQHRCHSRGPPPDHHAARRAAAASSCSRRLAGRAGRRRLSCRRRRSPGRVRRRRALIAGRAAAVSLLGGGLPARCCRAALLLHSHRANRRRATGGGGPSRDGNRMIQWELKSLGGAPMKPAAARSGESM